MDEKIAWLLTIDFDENDEAMRAFEHLRTQEALRAPGVSVARPELAKLKIAGTRDERVERILVDIDAELKSLGLAPRMVIVEEWLPEYLHWRYHRKPGMRDSGGDWLSAILDGLLRGIW